MWDREAPVCVVQDHRVGGVRREKIQDDDPLKLLPVYCWRMKPVY